jgi:Ni,Fe-hydrogenase I cytochrome b subunit
VSLLGLSITLLVSRKAKTFMEAQQLSGIVVIPFLVLIFIQLTGLVVFRAVYVIGFAAVLVGISYLIIAKIGPRFDRERVIATVAP